MLVEEASGEEQRLLTGAAHAQGFSVRTRRHIAELMSTV